MPGRLMFGRTGFLLVGVSVLVTIWLSFAMKGEDFKRSLVMWVNLAGLTIGGAVGFFVLGALSSSFFLGRAEPGRMFMLGWKWFGISAVLHCGIGFMIWRSRQPQAELDVPVGPEIPENFDVLSDEEKLQFKAEMEEYIETSSIRLEAMKKRAGRLRVWALFCIIVGALLVGRMIVS